MCFNRYSSTIPASSAMLHTASCGTLSRHSSSSQEVFLWAPFALNHLRPWKGETTRILLCRGTGTLIVDWVDTHAFQLWLILSCVVQNVISLFSLFKSIQFFSYFYLLILGRTLFLLLQAEKNHFRGKLILRIAEFTKTTLSVVMTKHSNGAGRLYNYVFQLVWHWATLRLV